VPDDEFMTSAWDRRPVALLPGLRHKLLDDRGLSVVNHRLFRRLRYANSLLMRVNLLLLLVVAFLPFPTSVVAEAV
jgi:hypothetical protein